MATHHDQSSAHTVGSTTACPVAPQDSAEAIRNKSALLFALVSDRKIQHSSTWNNSMNQSETRSGNVFIVNPQELMRVGIRTLFESGTEFTVVGESSSREQALPLILQLKPDIVLLHLRAHDEKDIDTAKEILLHIPTMRILFLADALNDTTLLSAVSTGAQGYVLQDAGSETLMHAMRSIIKGQAYLDPGVTRHTFAYLRKVADREPERGRHLLSPQERRLLPLIAQGKTNKEIAAELGLSDKTVKNYLANVYSKLHLTRRSQAAAFYLKTIP
ncbi:MAG: DNA-binding response regulator [Nitrospira sp.]|nr:MAG: DNA-binding response regulator [Nitrospira sp.]